MFNNEPDFETNSSSKLNHVIQKKRWSNTTVFLSVEKAVKAETLKERSFSGGEGSLSLTESCTFTVTVKS